MVKEQLQALSKWTFWVGVSKLFFARRGMDSVSVLSYTTLLSIVPLLAIVISIFSTTALFQSFSQEIIDHLFKHLLPQASSEAESYLLQFSHQAAQLKGPSLIVILITSLMLLWSIDDKINSFWPNAPGRKWWVSLLHYLGVTFLGPLLIGLSFFLSSYLTAMPLIASLSEETSFWLSYFSLLGFFPLILNWLGFAFLYRYVPTTRIKWSSAMIGAAITAMAIEGLKNGFNLYLVWFPTYNLIYGAFAIVPIFLLWMYLNWFVVLISIAVVHQLEELKQKRNLQPERKEVSAGLKG